MQTFTKIRSPAFWLVLLLCAFELFLRLPYLLWINSANYLDYRTRFQNFAVYNPDDVIFSGTAIVLMIVFTAFLAHRFIMAEAPQTGGRSKLEGVGWGTYAVAIVTIASVFLGLRGLGLDAITDNISAKRDLDAMGVDALLYIFLKISLFNHVISAMFYISFLCNGRKIDLYFSIIFGIITAIISVIFSQRAILFVFGFEIIYLTYYFGNLNIRKLVTYGLGFLLILGIIGLLRSTSTEGLSLADAITIGIEKIMTSRYFFNIAKLGCLFEWQTHSGLIDFLSFNFLIEPFAPDSTVYFKDFGSLAGSEVFDTADSGVTSGFVSEFLLSFGTLVGTFFVFLTFLIIFFFEKQVLAGDRLPLFTFFALAKIPVLLNTSLGSFAYQVVIESIMVLPILMGIAWSQSGTQGPPAKQARVPAGMRYTAR